MRIAALYDIHGNLPALDAVMREVREAGVDGILVGGDVMPGPMPRECLARLLALDPPARFIHGNCERAVLAQAEALAGGEVTYWGTTSGRPLPAADHENMRWSAQQLGPGERTTISAWPMTLRMRIEGLGDVLFCHGTPRSETEIFTKRTAEERLRPLFDGLGAHLVMCGHTHMQFDRMVGGTRVVNAGSVGMPFGTPGARWALLGPDVELRQTSYDFEAAAERFRGTRFPGAQKFAHDLLEPPVEERMLELFGTAEVK
jgi:predicted phosphodiesterase